MIQSRTVLIAALMAMGLFVEAFGEGAPRGADRNWHAWRGPLATGEAPKADPAVEWGEKKNVRWKVEIPGRGHAAPIVWGDRVYIQTAVETSKEAEAAADVAGDVPVFATLQPGGSPPEGERRRGGGRGGRGRNRPPAPKNLYDFKVLALDRKTGKTVWSKTVREEKPHEAGHSDASQASNSPVTDGEHLYAYFGSRGLYGLTLDGKVEWEVDLGDMRTRNEFGEGSSPVLHGDTLIINWDHEGNDFIVAFDKKTGKERWRVERDEPTSWSTPIVVEVEGKPQVVVTATNRVVAYDVETGKEIWSCGGMTANTIPSPMAADGLLYAISGFRGAALLAIDYAKAKGDITETPAIAWTYDRDTPYVPSATLYNGRLYFVDNNRPLLSCLDAKTGKPHYEKERLAGIDGVYASLVAAKGRIYVVGRDGTTLVIKDGPKFEVLATNELEDGFDASPAIAGDELFLRGTKHLYCIADTD
ncbi:MAG TPA: PQQ-binding-like beta-propeller repeat protein [Phycisphaerae bacterium]|nr:PQQ-binding-like beta-propeller repeat protein [Phycisphaerae bacterium]